MTHEVKSRLVENSLDWHTRKGTPSTVEELVTAVFADAVVSEWFEYDGKRYRFRVETETTDVTPDRIRDLIAAIFSVKNTRSDIDSIEIVWTARNDLYIGSALSLEIESSFMMRDDWDVDFVDSELFHWGIVCINPIAFTILEVEH
jgi:P2-related tail formation protein